MGLAVGLSHPSTPWPFYPSPSGRTVKVGARRRPRPFSTNWGCNLWVFTLCLTPPPPLALAPPTLQHPRPTLSRITQETLDVLTESLAGLDHKMLLILNKVDQFDQVQCAPAWGRARGPRMQAEAQGWAAEGTALGPADGSA